MNFSLLAPLGLVALAALALPILIHLVRRIELRPTDFAALRWVGAGIRPRRRLRVERPWLLLLRLALLALLALLLARPLLTPPVAAARPWVVVAPGVDRAAARNAANAIDAEWHWLAPGFPLLEEAPSSSFSPSSSLLRELDADLPATSSLSVVVPDPADGLDGERPRLSRAVEWHVVAGSPRANEAASVGPPVRFVVRYAASAEASVEYLRAAVAAWNTREPRHYELDVQPASVAIPADTTWLAWLAPPAPEVSAWVERGGVALIANASASSGDALWKNAAGEVYARNESSGRGRMIELTGALIPSSLPLLLDADFPDRLLAALRGPPAAPTRAVAAAMRPLHETAGMQEASRSLAQARPLDAWLVMLIAGLFLLERIVATHARVESSE
jgi:hypothetical protein